MFADVYAWSGTAGARFSSVTFVSRCGWIMSFHEAAIVDGASKWRRGIWHIDLVAIRSLTMLVLILNLGSVDQLGYEKVLRCRIR